MRRVGRAALLVVAALLAALVAAELGLRAAALVAGERLERLRDDPALLEGADVAVYGDSTPFGWGASTSFPAELARATGLTVVNRSRPGVNSAQTWLVLRDDLERWSPRVIVIMTGVNDAWNLADVDPDLLGPLGAWRRWLPEPRLWRLARIWFTAGPGASAFDIVKPGSGDWSRREDTARRLDADAVARITSRSFARMAAAGRATGATVLFLGYQAEGWNGSAEVVERVLERDHGESFVEMRSLFAGDGASMILPDNFHPTDEGQRRIAGRLLDALAARGLIAR